MRALILLAACSYASEVPAEQVPLGCERSALPPPPPPKPPPVVLLPPPIVVVGADAERHLHPGAAPRAFAGVREASEGIPSAHASAIVAIAVTDDGAAAVTTDFSGATRLWPALDGSLVPVVVAADHPAQLAVTHDGNGFVIAALDRAGQLTFLTVGGSGAIGWQARVQSPRPFTRVVAAKEDFAAITDDGKLATFAYGGVPQATFAPPPGEHLVELAVRGHRHLALVRTAHGVRGRWFIDTGFIGEPTAVLPIEAEHAALSPAGNRLAATRKNHMGIAVLDLDRGKTRIAWKADEAAEGSFPIGFTSERDLWYVLEGEVALERDGKSELQKALVMRDSAHLAIGDRALAWAHGASIVTADGGTPRALGYRLSMPTEVVPLDHGFAIGDGQRLALIDDRFAERELPELPPGTTNVTAIDRHRALVSVDDMVLAVDLDDPKRNQKVIALPRSVVVYQPATHLFATTVTGGVRVGRYDVASDTFTDTTLIPYTEQIYRVDLPARGGVAIEAARGDKVLTISFALDKALVATELEARERTDDQIGVAPPPPRVARHGALVATLGDGRMRLRDGDRERWVVPARGGAGLMFTPRGALIALGGGLAQVDLATGALVGPRCGWMFGAWDDLESNFEAATTALCDPWE